MKKRTTAFFLLIVLAFSMVSCGTGKGGSDSEKQASKLDVATLFAKAEGMEVKTADVTLDVDLSGKDTETGKENKIKMGIKAASLTEESDKSKTTVSYKLGDETEYKGLTTAVIDGLDTYIDFSSLKTSLLDICNSLNLSQQAAIISMLPDAEYLKLDSDTLGKYVNVTAIKDKKTGEQVARVVVKYLMQTIQDVTKEVTPACISGTESAVTFRLTKENIVPVIDEILKLDLSAKYDEMVQKVEELGNADEFVEDFKGNKTSVLSNVQDALNEIKNEKDDFDAFNIEATVGIDGEKGSRTLTEHVNVAIEQKSEKVAFTIEAVCGEAAAPAEQISIPKNSVDFAEYMKQLYSMFGY